MGWAPSGVRALVPVRKRQDLLRLRPYAGPRRSGPKPSMTRRCLERTKKPRSSVSGSWGGLRLRRGRQGHPVGGLARKIDREAINLDHRRELCSPILFQPWEKQEMFAFRRCLNRLPIAHCRLSFPQGSLCFGIFRFGARSPILVSSIRFDFAIAGLSLVFVTSSLQGPQSTRQLSNVPGPPSDAGIGK